VYADGGDRWLDESAEVDPAFVAQSALVAEAGTDRFARAGGQGVAPRMARPYGPGRASAELVAMVAARRAVVTGSGSNDVSSLHIGDAGTAVTAALTVPSRIDNVGDDAPVTALRWTASLAGSLPGHRSELVDGGGEAARVGDRKAVPEAGQPRPQPGQALGGAPVLLVVR
jgi:nucleoside-diphosphate-sugar epimerase